MSTVVPTSHQKACRCFVSFVLKQAHQRQCREHNDDLSEGSKARLCRRLRAFVGKGGAKDTGSQVKSIVLLEKHALRKIYQSSECGVCLLQSTNVSRLTSATSRHRKIIDFERSTKARPSKKAWQGELLQVRTSYKRLNNDRSI